MGRRWVGMVIQVTSLCLPARPPLPFALSRPSPPTSCGGGIIGPDTTLPLPAPRLIPPPTPPGPPPFTPAYMPEWQQVDETVSPEEEEDQLVYHTHPSSSFPTLLLSHQSHRALPRPCAPAAAPLQWQAGASEAPSLRAQTHSHRQTDRGPEREGGKQGEREKTSAQRNCLFLPRPFMRASHELLRQMFPSFASPFLARPCY
jgi:hypothetical protein